MKEAAGEANLTVVAIILIGVIAAVVTPIISNMMNTTRDRTCCMNAGGKYASGSCSPVPGSASYDAAGYNKCVQEANDR